MNPHADPTGSAALARALQDELRQRREAKQWTREQLARRMPHHVDADAVRAHETDAHDLTVTHFVRLCTALDEEPKDVLEHALDRVNPGEDRHRHH